MAYWCDDQKLNMEQRLLDARQAEVKAILDAAQPMLDRMRARAVLSPVKLAMFRPTPPSGDKPHG